uniref:Uncharacterized protein n=1 Tax=viral metagenome TaxID=1070528 RepID=A0A6C0C080_9ZZZZ
MVRKRNAAHIEGHPKCIGCFFTGKIILQSFFQGTLWLLTCGTGSFNKKSKKTVIPTTANQNASYNVSLEIETIYDEEMKDGCI